MVPAARRGRPASGLANKKTGRGADQGTVVDLPHEEVHDIRTLIAEVAVSSRRRNTMAPVRAVLERQLGTMVRSSRPNKIPLLHVLLTRRLQEQGKDGTDRQADRRDHSWRHAKTSHGDQPLTPAPSSHRPRCAWNLRRVLPSKINLGRVRRRGFRSPRRCPPFVPVVSESEHVPTPYRGLHPGLVWLRSTRKARTL